MIRTAELKTADPAPAPPTKPALARTSGLSRDVARPLAKDTAEDSSEKLSEGRAKHQDAGPAAPTDVTPRPVVAVVLQCRGNLLLLKRSYYVAHDRGKWHCITGYIEASRDPAHQALDEIFEETGLRLVDLSTLTAGPVLNLADGDGRPWPVHTFVAHTDQRRLRINWEHITYRWVQPARLRRFDGRVEWLDDVVEAFDLLSPRRPDASAKRHEPPRSATVSVGPGQAGPDRTAEASAGSAGPS